LVDRERIAAAVESVQAQERARVPIARRGRRRANLPGGPRRHRVVVRVSDGELAELQALAGERGVSVPAVLVQSTLAGGLEAAGAFEQLREELGLALRLVASISGNVNQLARQANTAAGGVEASPVTAAQLAAVTAALDRTLTDLRTVTRAALAVRRKARVRYLADPGPDHAGVEDYEP
jgi:Bacterial mobilisation protein (MobC)